MARWFYRGGGYWHIGFDYDASIVAEVKKFTGAGYNPENREWYVPLHITTSGQVQRWLNERGFEEGMNYRPSPRVINYVEPEEIISPEDVAVAVQELNLLRTPRSYQCEGISYMLNHGNCINGDDCGLGKAQPLTTKILTPDGYILMKDIKVGDEILDPTTGGLQYVEAVFPQGVKPMYKVIFTDKTFTYCCNEHLWAAQGGARLRRGHDFSVVSLQQMIDRGLFVAHDHKEYYWQIPMTHTIEYGYKPVRIQPYLMGVLLGDGDITRSVRLTTADPEMLEYCELPQNYHFRQTSYKSISYNICHDSVECGCNPKNLVKTYLNEYGLLGHHSYEKFIPKDYLYNTEEVRLEVLRGLLDTDGYISDDCGHIAYSTTSRQLADDVKWLVWSLGGVVREKNRIGRYVKDGVKHFCRKSYRLSIMLPPEIIPVKLKRKVERLNTNRKYVPVKKIKNVEYVGGAEMQCIKVSNPSGLYLCDDFIVTHNTGQSICTTELLNSFPCLVICPASVKYNWKKEWAKWNPNRTVGVVERKGKMKPEVWDNDVVVINFDVLGERNLANADDPDSKKPNKPKAKFKELLKKYWGSCIIDEIHFLKSEKATRTKMAKKITRNIAHVWGLTGTLTQNRPAELIQPYQIIRRFEDIFGDTKAFKFRYCDGKYTEFGFDASGFSNLEELHELLRMSAYIRRDKRDVLTELPPLIEDTVDVPITNRKAYQHAEDDLLSYLETIDIAKASSAANAPHLVMINTLRKLSIEGKMDFIKTYIKEWLDANEDKQLLVFGVHREPLQQLSEHFSAPVIQGGVALDEKQRIVDSFAEMKHRVLFANIQSAGTGTDGLQTNCSDMIYIELPDKSTDIEQTNSRLERMGQKSTITVTYLLSPETIDVEMMETIESKKLLTGIVNAGEREDVLLAKKFFRKHRENQ